MKYLLQQTAQLRYFVWDAVKNSFPSQSLWLEVVFFTVKVHIVDFTVFCQYFGAYRVVIWEIVFLIFDCGSSQIDFLLFY